MSVLLSRLHGLHCRRQWSSYCLILFTCYFAWIDISVTVVKGLSWKSVVAEVLRGLAAFTEHKGSLSWSQKSTIGPSIEPMELSLYLIIMIGQASLRCGEKLKCMCWEEVALAQRGIKWQSYCACGCDTLPQQWEIIEHWTKNNLLLIDTEWKGSNFENSGRLYYV